MVARHANTREYRGQTAIRVPVHGSTQGRRHLFRRQVLGATHTCGRNQNDMVAVTLITFLNGELAMTRQLWCGALMALAVGAEAWAADNAAAQVSLNRFKKLAGEWVQADDQGKPTGQIVSVYKVTAAGSVVHETMFPGSDHEMVTVFHCDGPDFVVTHYCAAGNQPRLKADPKSPPNRIDFKFVGGSNLDPAKDMHMHEGSITFVDDDHIEWSWVGYKDGKPADGHRIALKLVRKK
jgi:hypothetical protein